MKLILFSCKYLLRAKANNLIKIISLTLGLSVGIILLSQVAFDLSYDRCLSDRDRLYQINMWEWDMPQLTAPVLPTLRNELPGITEGTMFVPKNQQAIYFENQRIEIGLAWVDSSFFDFFGIPILQGDFPKSFPNEKALFLSASTARKIFGNQDPIGQIILFDKSTPYEVAGIFRDFPSNCHLSYIQAALPLTDPTKVITNTSWLGSTVCRGYVKLAQGIDPQSLSARIPEVVSQHIENGASLNINLKPVSTLHLNNPTVREQIFIKSFLALIVMFIAAMNYVLASISSLSIRSRTMAVYKCYGCSNNKIFGMVLGETAILILLSILLSALLLFGFRNQIQPILTSPFEAIFTPQNLTEAILLICILFLLTGFIPAKIYSNIPVALAFRHNTLNKRLWKQTLLSLQYIGATLLITLLVIIVRQNNFILNQSPGYRYENLLYINLTDLTPEQANVVKAELSRIPAVEGVCLGNPPLFGWWGDGLYDPVTGNEGHAQWTEISSGYIRLLGMEIVDGQEFNEYTAPNQVIVNESLVKMMQWTDSPVGKEIRVGPYSYRIIGVVKNFQNNTFHGSGDPGKYLFYPAVMIYSNAVPTVILQMHFLSAEALTLIQEKLNDLFPDKGFEIHVYKEDFEQQYAREIRLRDMVMYGSIIALLIALIGLIGYTNNEIQRRDQEIAIRKVNGASAGDIFRLIMHDVRWYILGAIVVGLIGAYHFAGKWLQQFMIKIPLSAWMFICCGVIICIITIATIFFKTWRTANENPVKSIKKE